MNIDSQGMAAANLNAAQINELKDAEKKLNAGKATQEIYLLAVEKQT